MKRARTPEETIKILEPFLYKSSITRIADLTLLDNTSVLKVFSAIRPLAKSISVSMGKSLDALSAKCGAIVESFETYLAEEVRADLENVSSSELSTEKVIKNEKNYGYRCRFGGDYPLNWHIGYEIDTKAEVYIPSYLVSLDTNNLTNQFWSSSSDGIASGNTFEEALIVSLFERIERIAVKNNIRSTLNFDKKIIAKYCLSSDYICNFFEYENDFNVPVVGAELYNKSHYANQCVYCGYGASDTYKKALYRAIEEALQTKIGVISGARDDLKNEYYCADNTVKSKVKLSESNGMYPEITYDNSLDLLDKVKALIRLNGYSIVYFEYFNDNFFVVKTFLVDSESNIL